MDELIQRIGLIKAAMDNGFSRVGPSLGSDPVAGWLIGAASRSIALANAVALLCRRQLANESLPIVRTLVETAVRMRWLASGPARARLALLEEERRQSDWGRLWSAPALLERMAEAGLAQVERRRLLSALEAQCRAHLEAGSAGLPWSHAFPENRAQGVEPEAVLRTAVEALAEALGACEARWPGAFPAVAQGRTP